jgi:hypothetical protein
MRMRFAIMIAEAFAGVESEARVISCRYSSDGGLS